MANLFKQFGGIILFSSALSLFSCSKDSSTQTSSQSGLPTITISDSAKNITAQSATFTCNVTSAGSTTLIEKGICYSTSANPTISNSTVVRSSSTGNSFSLTQSTFTKGTTYYVKAYAKNSLGVGYSNEITFRTYGYTGQAGGLVFYDKGVISNGWRYLEVSPVDIGTTHQWGKDSLISGANNSTLGGGYQNSIDMINANLINPSWAIPTAVQVVKAYSLNGYNDWYLPSDIELSSIWSCLAKYRIGGFASLNGINYWSSTQLNKSNANYYNLDGVGGGGYNSKVGSMAIRAVRRY